MSVYHRTQILLEPEQHAALTEIAANEKRSVSEIMREMAAKYLAEQEQKNKRKKALAALERLTEMRLELAERNTEFFPDPVDMIREMHEERMQDIERVMKGED